MNGLHRSNIDYIAQSGESIGREGYVLNICTGCRHYMTDICHIDCYAKRLCETRLRDNPGYPYGFEPTFHPERIGEIGGKPKLIFLNDMGDVGGDWTWKDINPFSPFTNYSDEFMAGCMVDFANLNPQHILLLLTKRPEWYGLAEWPENVWCGFTATNNDELIARYRDAVIANCKNIWGSYEPWLDEVMPHATGFEMPKWNIIGGLSGKHPRPVSKLTLDWLQDKSEQARRFTKQNIFGAGNGYLTDEHAHRIEDFPREYPDWRLK